MRTWSSSPNTGTTCSPDEHLKALERIFSDVCASFDCRLEEFNGETDHVHLLVSFPPTVELSRLVNSLKGVSSRYLRRDYPELARHYWRRNASGRPATTRARRAVRRWTR